MVKRSEKLFLLDGLQMYSLRGASLLLAASIPQLPTSSQRCTQVRALRGFTAFTFLSCCQTRRQLALRHGFIYLLLGVSCLRKAYNG